MAANCKYREIFCCHIHLMWHYLLIDFIKFRLNLVLNLIVVDLILISYINCNTGMCLKGDK